jgi:hypothetical protein
VEGLNSGESAGIALGPVLLRLGLLSFSVEAMIVEVNCVLKMMKNYFIVKKLLLEGWLFVFFVILMNCYSVLNLLGCSAGQILKSIMK